MNAHGQPVPVKQSRLHRVEGRRIDEVRIEADRAVTLMLDDGSSLRLVATCATDVDEYGEAPSALAAEVVG